MWNRSESEWVAFFFVRQQRTRNGSTVLDFLVCRQSSEWIVLVDEGITPKCYLPTGPDSTTATTPSPNLFKPPQTRKCYLRQTNTSPNTVNLLHSHAGMPAHDTAGPRILEQHSHATNQTPRPNPFETPQSILTPFENRWSSSWSSDWMPDGKAGSGAVGNVQGASIRHKNATT